MTGGNRDAMGTTGSTSDGAATTVGAADGGKNSQPVSQLDAGGTGSDAGTLVHQDTGTNNGQPDVYPNAQPDGATPDVAEKTLPVVEGAVLGSGQEADNVTAYLLTAGADGSAYIAGFTSDWAKLGIANPGSAGIPFAAHIDNSGKVAWATPLPATWWPYAVALDGDELIVVSASFDSPTLSAFSYSASYAVARVSAQGTIAARRIFTYSDGVRPSAVVVDGGHLIHVAASTTLPPSSIPGINEAFELARLKPDLSVDKVTKFAHTGGNARINALQLAHNGDLLLAGYFDNSVNFGGGALQTKNLGTYYACAGFFARLTVDHSYVIATQVGGDNFADVLDVVEQNGSIYVAGAITGAASVGGVSVTGDAKTSGFVAKLSAQAKAEWVNVWPGQSWVSALAAGSSRIIAAGSLGDARYIVQDVRDKPAQPDQAALTLTTEKINPMALAAGGGGFWLSLGFHDQIALAPAGTKVQGKASTLLLRFAQ